MNLTIESQNFIRGIDTLDYIDKLFLLSYITNDLIKSGVKTNRRLTELKGLGSEMWQNCDVDKYIQNERASWD